MTLFMLAPQALAASTIISATLCEPTFIAPELTAPADGLETTDSTVQAVGTVEPDMVVNILRNSVVAASVTAAPDGTFGVAVPLVAGENELQASASNPCELTQTSGTVTVTRLMPPDPDPPVTPPVQPPAAPTIDDDDNDTPVIPNPGTGDGLYAPILNPLESTVNTQRLWVDGIAPPSVIVTVVVNGEAIANVTTAPDGSFGVLVTLKRGQNTIQAQVITTGQVFASAVSTVTFMPSMNTASPTEPDNRPFNILLVPVLMISAGVGFSLWWLLLFRKLRYVRLVSGHHWRFR